MKKIYSLIGAVAISSMAFAQQSLLTRNQADQKMIPSRFNYIGNSTGVKNKSVAGGVVAQRVDPMQSVYLRNNGGTPGVMGTDVRVFITPVNCDSLVKFTYSSGPEFINTHMVGIVFDPQSISQGDSYTALFSRYDAYTIDTLWFGGQYNRISASSVVDTLVVDVAWSADTLATTNNLYYKWTLPALTRFGSMLAPKFAVSTPTAHGLQARLSNPTAANYARYKIPLNVSDTNEINNVSGYLGYELKNSAGVATPLAIPAGHRVTIAYTFKAGMPYSLGDVAFGNAGNPQTVNAWGPTMYSQYPQPSGTAAYLDFFNDYNPGKNSGIFMSSEQRYGTMAAGYVQTNNLYNRFESGYMIDISLRGTSTVGVKEVESKGFILGQNVPNPFNGQSVVSYNIDKEVSSAVFTVTDVTGRVISTEKVDASKGTHSINLGNYSAGVYYYSLNVDGNVTTKKMIAQ